MKDVKCRLTARDLVDTAVLAVRATSIGDEEHEVSRDCARRGEPPLGGR